MADLRVHSDRIAVMPIEDKVSSGGILKPQGSVKREIPVLRGRVVVTGPGQMLENGQYSDMPVGPGDTVQYLGAHTVEVTINDVKYHIIDLSTLICVETKDKNRDGQEQAQKLSDEFMKEEDDDGNL